MNNATTFILVSSLVSIMLRFLVRQHIRSTGLYSLFVLPGTFLHELCHFVVAILFWGKPRHLTIVPHHTAENRVTLGSVTCYRLNNLNSFPIAMAPLLILLIPVFLYSRLNIGVHTSPYCIILILYILFSVLPAAWPSMVDINMALTKPVGTAAWLVLTYLLLSRQLSFTGLYNDWLSLPIPFQEGR